MTSQPQSEAVLRRSGRSRSCCASCRRAVQAHHSFAMYDLDKTYVMTGVVTRVDPNPNHLQIFFAPLNEARDQVLRDGKGEPVVWALEMDAARSSPRDGITVNNFPRGTIISVGLHPLRNGFPGGGRGRADCSSARPTRRRRRESTVIR